MKHADWRHYPMGPQLRTFLAISDSDYQGESTAAIKPDAAAANALADHVISLLQSRPIEDYNQWVNLVEELNMMALSRVVIFLAEEDFHPQIQTDFRGLLAIGSSYILEQRWDEIHSFDSS